MSDELTCPTCGQSVEREEEQQQEGVPWQQLEAGKTYTLVTRVKKHAGAPYQYVRAWKGQALSFFNGETGAALLLGKHNRFIEVAAP